MKMQQLEYFVTVSRCGSLGRAAEELFTSQPNVSKVIHSLESELGTTLFDRNPRGLKLNEYGKAIYEYANSIIKNSNMITAVCDRQLPDTFNISTFQSNSLARMLIDLYKCYPDIRIIHRQGNIEEIVKNVESGISEIGILFIAKKRMQSLTNILAGKRLEYIEVGTAGACINAGPLSELYTRDTIDYSELKGQHFVSGIQDYFSENTFSHKNLGIAGTGAFTVAVSSNCNQMLYSIVEQTSLLDFNISCAYKGIPNSLNVKTVKITGDEAELSWGYIAEKDYLLSRPAATGIELLKENYKPTI